MDRYQYPGQGLFYSEMDRREKVGKGREKIASSCSFFFLILARDVMQVRLLYRRQI